MSLKDRAKEWIKHQYNKFNNKANYAKDFLKLKLDEEFDKFKDLDLQDCKSKYLTYIQKLKCFEHLGKYAVLKEYIDAKKSWNEGVEHARHEFEVEYQKSLIKELENNHDEG